jgi:hypothetical protein
MSAINNDIESTGNRYNSQSCQFQLKILLLTETVIVAHMVLTCSVSSL